MGYDNYLELQTEDLTDANYYVYPESAVLPYRLPPPVVLRHSHRTLTQTAKV